MKAQWRLLDLPPMTAAENMALDEVLVEVRGSGHSRDTLRFLQFRPATVLVGFHQSLQEEVRLSYCREHGIDVNRRITGGGGLLCQSAHAEHCRAQAGRRTGHHPVRARQQ